MNVNEPASSHPLRWRWLPLVYYYLAAAVGLVLLLVGLVGGLRGLVHAALPNLTVEVTWSENDCRQRGVAGPVAEKPMAEQPARTPTPAEIAVCARESEERVARRGLGEALDGLVMVVVAGPFFVWHLRQARRREPGSER